VKLRRQNSLRENPQAFVFNGGRYWNRTSDPMHVKHGALYFTTIHVLPLTLPVSKFMYVLCQIIYHLFSAVIRIFGETLVKLFSLAELLLTIAPTYIPSLKTSVKLPKL
jgi:hypothetical protein